VPSTMLRRRRFISHRGGSHSTLTRRFAPPSPSGRGIDFRTIPLPLGEGGAKRRVRVEFFKNLIHYYAPLLLALICVQPSFAQTWNYAGPYAVPSRILSVTSDPRSDSTVYVVVAGGGIWKTQDTGGIWTHLFDSGPEQICSLALDPRFPDVIYAGTGDDQSPRPLQGIARSQDGGKTWTFLARFTNRPVCAIAVDPARSERLFAASQEGLFFSRDTGSTWTRVLDVPVTSVALDALGNVYAGTIGDDAAGARDKVVARSSDGGLTWSAQKLSPNPNGVTAVTNWVGVYVVGNHVFVTVSYQLTPSVPGTNAVSAAAPQSYLDFYRSTDAGTTWSAPFNLGQGRPPYALITNADKTKLYFAANRLLVSSDQGSGWSSIPTTTDAYHALAFTSGMLLLGGETGLTAVSLDGNPTRAIAPLPVGQFLAANLDSVNAVWAAGLAGLFGPLSAITDSHVSGIGPVGAVAASASGSNILASSNGAVQISTDAGAQFNAKAVIADGELRAPFPPLVLDPVVTASAYVAGRRLYHTTNNGNTWTQLPIVDPDPTHVIIALAQAQAARATLFAATACLPEIAQTSCNASTQIWRSANSGTTWTQLPPVTGYVNRLAVDPRQTNTIYAAVGAYPGGPSAGAGLIPGDLLRSMNGQPWTSIRGNLPDAPINAVVIDPTSVPAITLPMPGMPIPGLPGGFAVFNAPAQKLYVATDDGVFVTFNAGGLWTEISSNLPHTPVTDVVLRQPGNALVAATFGRGVYVTSAASLAAGVTASRFSIETTLVHGATLTTGIPLTNASTNGTNSWRLNSLDPWITIPQPNGSLAPGASAQVALRVSAVDLQPGIYVGRVELVSGPFVQSITVEAHVTAAPAQMKSIGPTSLTGAAGGLVPLQVLLSDANQAPLPGITVTFAISSGGGSLSAVNVHSSSTGVAKTTLTLPLTSGTVRVVASSGDLSVEFTVAVAPAPALLANSAVDGVTFNPYTPLGPGSVVYISGQNLADGVLSETGTSLPTLLLTTRVLLTGSTGELALPLFSVATDVVRALLPYDLLPGAYGLRVETAGRRSNEIQILVAAYAPGIFTVSGNGRGAGVFIKEDGSLVTATNPADRGSRVTFFAAGLGAVNPPVPAGTAGTAATLRTPRVFFDSYAAEVSFSGLASSLPGRYQVTVRVPALVAPATNISVSLTIGTFSSNRVTIPVR
jgi:uncharacterized protein (TIGR03437 family)